MKLFTSIRPPASDDEASYLRDCLNSWRAAGFTPVAVNGPSEIERLHNLDLPVEFAPMAIDGKPRIGDILSAIRNAGVRFAGIINSDCKIAGYPGLAAKLEAGLDRMCVLVWRVDVGDGIKPSAASHGFDAYFFDTRFVPEEDCGFSIGDPWWDYWFPLACEMQGAWLQTLAVPLLTHRVHPLNWQRRKWEAGAERLWTALRGWRHAATAPRSLYGSIPAAWWGRTHLTAVQVSSLSLIVPAWFYEHRPQTMAILPPEMAELETMFAFGGRALLDAADLTVAQNALRRIIGPLRMVVTIFRRVRARWMQLRRLRELRWSLRL
jgi:hypothetical protein